MHTKTWHTTTLIDDFPIRKTFTSDIDKFANHLKNSYPNANIVLGYEAGCFGFTPKEKLDSHGFKTIIAHPADIPTTDKDKRQKTDKRDSQKIADGLKGGKLKGIYIPSRQSQENRTLLRRYHDLSRQQTRIKNIIKGNLKFYGITFPEQFEKSGTHWSKAFISWISNIKYETISGNDAMASYIKELLFIRGEIVLITKKLRALSRSERYASDYNFISQIPGIGLINGMTLLLELIEIERFKSNDNFINFVGLAPTEHTTGGKRRIGHLSRRCRVILRTTIIEASWVAIRYDSSLSQYYAAQCKKGKSSYAIIKVARKLANRIRYILLHKVPYIKGIENVNKHYNEISGKDLLVDNEEKDVKPDLIQSKIIKLSSSKDLLVNNEEKDVKPDQIQSKIIKLSSYKDLFVDNERKDVKPDQIQSKNIEPSSGKDLLVNKEEKDVKPDSIKTKNIKPSSGKDLLFDNEEKDVKPDLIKSKNIKPSSGKDLLFDKEEKDVKPDLIKSKSVKSRTKKTKI